MVEETGKAILFKRNQPKYLMIDINNQAAIDQLFEELKGRDKDA